MAEERDYSLKTEAIIDREIDRLLSEGVETAKKILVEHMDKLDAVSEFLLENETIDSDQFEAIMEDRDPHQVRSASPAPGGDDSPKETDSVQEPSGSSAVDPSPAI